MSDTSTDRGPAFAGNPDAEAMQRMVGAAEPPPYLLEGFDLDTIQVMSSGPHCAGYAGQVVERAGRAEELIGHDGNVLRICMAMVADGVAFIHMVIPRTVVFDDQALNAMLQVYALASTTYAEEHPEEDRKVKAWLDGSESSSIEKTP